MGLIYEKIPAIMNDLNAVGKNNVNGQQNWKYRGIDDVMNALHPLLSKHGVFVVPEILEQKREEKQTSKGNTLNYSICTIKFHITATDGSSVHAVTIGEGMDSGDKSSNKAMAVAFKYAMFQTFCIPTEEMKNDDPDKETHETVPDKITPNMLRTILSEMKRTGITKKTLTVNYKVNSLEELNVLQFKEIIKIFERTPDKQDKEHEDEGKKES